MAHGGGDSRRIRSVGRNKFDLDLGTDGKIRHGEQAHPDIADIDPHRLQWLGAAEYPHGSVQQLALSAAPLWFEGAAELHG